MLIVGGVIPLVVLIALNTKIYLAIRERTQRLATMTSRQRRSVSILRKKYIFSWRAQKWMLMFQFLKNICICFSRDLAAATVLVGIILVFIVCHSFKFVVNIYEAYLAHVGEFYSITLLQPFILLVIAITIYFHRRDFYLRIIVSVIKYTFK